MTQLYLHIVQTLGVLKTNVDSKSNDKPKTLKQAMHHLDWPKWYNDMQAKYNFLVKNKT